MLGAAIPTLPAADVARALEFYETKLGFTRLFLYGDDYGAVRRDACEIHFWKCGDPRIAANTSIRIPVQGIEELFAACQDQGIVHPRGSLTTQPWGFKEFVALDADSNCLKFVERAG